MKRKWVVGLLVIVLLGAAFGVWKSSKGYGKKRGDAPQMAIATEGSIEETVDATGDVAPLNRVEIKPPISGRIEKLLVDEGDRVKAGATLAWMSSSDRAAILDAARAQGTTELKHWEDSYKPTPLIAPLSGVVILRNVVVGQTVDASTVLFAMSDKLVVIAQVDEADIGRVRLEMPARITLDAYPDHAISGTVFQILHEGKNVSNVITYGVKVEPKEVPAFFRSQMTANVGFTVRRQENAVLVPASAVTDNRAGGKQVMVPGPDGKPVAKEVQVGIENGEKVEILSGLEAGERLIVSRTRYVPQKGAQNSPLTMGGRPPSGGGDGGRRQ